MSGFDRWYNIKRSPPWVRRTWHFLLVAVGVALLSALMWWAE